VELAVVAELELVHYIIVLYIQAVEVPEHHIQAELAVAVLQFIIEMLVLFQVKLMAVQVVMHIHLEMVLMLEVQAEELVIQAELLVVQAADLL
jgi:hypothetical protein